MHYWWGPGTTLEDEPSSRPGEIGGGFTEELAFEERSWQSDKRGRMPQAGAAERGTVWSHRRPGHVLGQQADQCGWRVTWERRGAGQDTGKAGHGQMIRTQRVHPRSGGLGLAPRSPEERK